MYLGRLPCETPKGQVGVQQKKVSGRGGEVGKRIGEAKDMKFIGKRELGAFKSCSYFPVVGL